MHSNLRILSLMTLSPKFLIKTIKKAKKASLKQLILSLRRTICRVCRFQNRRNLLKASHLIKNPPRTLVKVISKMNQMRNRMMTNQRIATQKVKIQIQTKTQRKSMNAMKIPLPLNWNPQFLIPARNNQEMTTALSKETARVEMTDNPY